MAIEIGRNKSVFRDGRVDIRKREREGGGIYSILVLLALPLLLNYSHLLLSLSLAGGVAGLAVNLRLLAEVWP